MSIRETKPTTRRRPINSTKGKFGWVTIYKSSMCDQVIAMGAQGKSKRAIAAELNINRDTLYEWIKKRPEFAEAMSKSQDLAYVYFEKMGMEALKVDNNKFNTTLYKYITLSRFREDFINDNTHETNINTDGKGGLSITIKSYADHPTE